MRSPRTRTGRIARAVAVATLAITLASCSLGRSPDQITPTDTPWSGELLYEPVGPEFCEQMRWDSVSGPGITWGEITPERYPAPRGLSWVACDIKSIGADYLREGAHVNMAWLNLDTFDNPQDAYATYNSRVATAENLPNPVVEAVAGWWDEGTAVESVRSPGGGVIGSLTYYIHHENLYLMFRLLGQFTTTDRTDVLTAGAIAKFHEVARAVIEEARVHLSCRSLVDPPATDCG